MSHDRLRRLASELRQQEEIQESLRTARRRQLHMLPRMPDVRGIEFAAVYNPAATISGDFYDIIQLPNDCIGIAMGDVSGHGVEAGILMGMVKKALQIYALAHPNAREPLVLTNANIAGDLDGETFISALYGVLDVRAASFRFARAGHNPPLLVNPQRTPPLQELSPNGMVIGPDKTGRRFAAVLTEQEIQLQPGDLVMAYTDGLVEAKGRDETDFGEKRLKSLLVKHAQSGAAELLALLEETVDTHLSAKAQEDDITMVAFKVT